MSATPLFAKLRRMELFGTSVCVFFWGDENLGGAADLDLGGGLEDSP